MKYKNPRKVFNRYFTTLEERALLATIRRVDDVLAKRDLQWIIIARQTGVRVSVLAGLVCLDAREALRNDSLLVRGEINKGGKTYSVPLNKPARQALQELLRLRRRMGYIEEPEETLIVNRRGGAMSVRSFEARMAEWVKLAGLRDGSPHWLRHTLAKRLMKNSTARDPRAVVMQVLGQSDINSTVIYTMPDREDIETAMQEAAA